MQESLQLPRVYQLKVGNISNFMQTVIDETLEKFLKTPEQDASKTNSK